MKKETDLGGVKAIAKTLLMTAVNQTPYSPMLVQHPFTSTGLVALPTEKYEGFRPIDITLNEENLKRWQDSVSQIIDETENPNHIYMLLNPPYALTFLKLASPYLSRKDFSEILASAWINCEAPHNDPELNKEALKALENIPTESENAFLCQRTDIKRDEWELGKTAWQTVLLFMGITALVTVAMLGFFGCAAVTVRGIILCLILLYSSYSDIRTRECSDYLHLMIVIAAFIGCKTAELPAMILGGVLVGAVMLVPLLTGNRTLGGADIKCSAACAFLLGLKRGLIGLTAGLLLAVIINGIKNRKKKDKSFPLLPYLSVGFTAAYFI